jgi:hypothetical protein
MNGGVGPATVVKIYRKSLIHGWVMCQRSAAYGETVYMEEFFPVRIL